MPRFLIVGATGQQGGATVRALLEKKQEDLQIRGLTRSPSSSKAQQLSDLGVEMVKGDLDDREALSAALTDCDAACLVTDFLGPGGVPAEIRQGKLFIDVAKERGVNHIVFTSVNGADHAAPFVAHYASKIDIETHLKTSGLSWTIVRAPGFMENIPPPGLGRTLMLSVMAAYFGSTRQKHIACADIGQAVALGLLEPAAHRGRTYELVADVLTAREVRDALGRGDGSASWVLWLPRWAVMKASDGHMREMFQWLYENEQPGDVESTKALLGNVITVEDWARMNYGRKKV